MNNKILLLIRHGKAIDGKVFPGNDFDRPLLEDGKKEFKILANFLKEKIFFTPEIILTSSAKRCLETAEILQDEYKLDDSVFFSTNNLYFADGVLGQVEHYFHELSKIETSYHIVALVGHNWTITDFASELLGEPCASMEKGSIMILQFKNGYTWKTLTKNSCDLLAYITPQIIQ